MEGWKEEKDRKNDGKGWQGGIHRKKEDIKEGKRRKRIEKW